MQQQLIIRDLGIAEYQPIWEAMKTFTDGRQPETPDEIWLLEHPPVFTQGQAGKPEHVLNAGDIPIVQTDRGGQITYHGPGQLIVYVLLDLNRLKMGTRDLVTTLENVIIQILNDYKISAHARRDAPGVYVDDAKICSLGLRVRKGFSYHGLAFNINMDLTPFSSINPCGYAGQKITQLRDFIPDIQLEAVKQKFQAHFCRLFRYNPSTL